MISAWWLATIPLAILAGFFIAGALAAGDSFRSWLYGMDRYTDEEIVGMVRRAWRYEYGEDER